MALNAARQAAKQLRWRRHGIGSALRNHIRAKFSQGLLVQRALAMHSCSRQESSTHRADNSLTHIPAHTSAKADVQLVPFQGLMMERREAVLCVAPALKKGAGR
eukprot:357723-Chlamydomonas_euryale.AAC.26